MAQPVTSFDNNGNETNDIMASYSSNGSWGDGSSGGNGSGGGNEVEMMVED